MRHQASGLATVKLSDGSSANLGAEFGAGDRGALEIARIMDAVHGWTGTGVWTLVGVTVTEADVAGVPAKRGLLIDDRMRWDADRREERRAG